MSKGHDAANTGWRKCSAGRGRRKHSCQLPYHTSSINQQAWRSEQAHAGAWLTCWNMPRGVRTADTCCPAPPQAEQVLAEVPGFVPVPLHVWHLRIKVQKIKFGTHNVVNLHWGARTQAYGHGRS